VYTLQAETTTRTAKLRDETTTRTVTLRPETTTRTVTLQAETTTRTPRCRLKLQLGLSHQCHLFCERYGQKLGLLSIYLGFLFSTKNCFHLIVFFSQYFSHNPSINKIYITLWDELFYSLLSETES
jgi:hypothetical protein